jgi:nucleotide-binding universal stress UspA family protein
MARPAWQATIGATSTEELCVYRKIIVGWNGTEQARDALALATRLRAPEGTITAACVYLDPGGMRARAGDRGIIDAAEETAAKARADTLQDWLFTRAVPGHSPAHGLHMLVEHEGAGLVVVGSSHRGEMGQVVAGSGGHRLLTGSPCPVAVAPNGFHERSDRIGLVAVAYDGSDEADTTLHEGASLAAGLGARLKLIGIVPPLNVWFGDGAYAPPPPPPEELLRARHRAWEKTLDEAIESLAGRVEASREVRSGIPSDELANAAREGVDLMVTGSRNYGPLRRVMIGSTAVELMCAATCPVIVIPRGAATPSAAGEARAAATA